MLEKLKHHSGDKHVEAQPVLHRQPTATEGDMATRSPVNMPSRQGTQTSAFSDSAVPESDPSSTAGLLAERLQAWKHAVVYLEEYVTAVEKIHNAHAKEYEKVLKTISKPLREGQHFDQSLGGVAGFFENMRANTQALINTNAETGKNIKGSVLPVIERLHQEIKNKSKELAHGAQKSAKEVDKYRNSTQKHIEMLGQHAATFESMGGKLSAENDPYVIQRGVLHRLNRQVLEENNHRNDLIAVQNNFQTFEAHIITVVQQAMESFNQYTGGQAERTRAVYSDMLGAAQRIPPDFEWKQFEARSAAVLVNPNDDPRSADSIQFPNMAHPSTKSLIEGSLERKSRNKLSWGYSTGYYVVTPSKFLHEFKDNDNIRTDPKPELSIYLPDAIIGAPSGEKFSVKGKDKSKGMGSKLSGNSELNFKAHTAADAQKWFDIIRGVAGATGPAALASGTPTPTEEGDRKQLGAQQPAPLATGQEAGVVAGGQTTASPATMSPVAANTAGIPVREAAPGAGSVGPVGTTGTAGSAAAPPAEKTALA